MLGMPSIEIEFEFDMVFCFGIRLAPYAVFSTRIYLQHIARPVESDRLINIVFVRPSVRSSVISLCMYGHNSTTARIDLCNFKERSRKDISPRDNAE